MRLRSVAKTMIMAAVLASGQAYAGAAAGAIEIRGKSLYVDGKKFTVKGIHYGPWRPGTGPAKGYPYPGPDLVEADLRQIESLHANTILVADPPGYVLDLAAKKGFRVLYSFYVNWWALGTPESTALRDSILERVRQYRDKPALLGWVLGNEIPLAVIEQKGEKAVEEGLAQLYAAVKALDGEHPVTHANWTVTKDLNLRFFDVISFNVYPLWPPQLVAMGYGRYIEEALQPVAQNKPLLITEFGANSLEANEQGQSRLLEQCWKDLLKAGACGGVVFEFADEWWKNYDNPRRSSSWWDRGPAPNDERAHDADPEEYYGIVQGDRQPKPAFAAVRGMFSADGDQLVRPERLLPALAVGLLLLAACAAWLVAVRRARSASRQSAVK